MNNKRRYHPLILLLYTSNMLDYEQVAQIPKTTLAYWKHFELEDCYGADWAEKYICQFEQIKEIYASSFLFKSMRLMVQTRKGFPLHNSRASRIKKVNEKVCRIYGRFC